MKCTHPKEEFLPRMSYTQPTLGGVCEMHTPQGGVPPKDVIHTVSLGGVCEMHTPQGGVPPKDVIHTANLRRSV